MIGAACVLLVIGDRIMKSLALSHLGEGVFVTKKYAGIFVIGDVIGTSLILLSCVLVVLHAYYWRKQGKDLLCHTAILLGAASNVFDRITYGGVIDWFGIDRFAFMNGADLLIIGGVVVLCIREMRSV